MPIKPEREDFTHGDFKVSVFPYTSARRPCYVGYAADGKVSLLSPKFFGLDAFERARSFIISMIDRKVEK